MLSVAAILRLIERVALAYDLFTRAIIPSFTSYSTLGSQAPPAIIVRQFPLLPVWTLANRPLFTARDSNPTVLAAEFEREILKSSGLKFSCFREKRWLGGNMGVDGSPPDFKGSRHN